MTNFTTKNLMVFVTILSITGFAVYAFAHGGGNHMGGSYGMMNGYHMNGGGHMWNNLSAEDQKIMQDQMNDFFSSTQGLRDQYYQKKTELNQEYSKAEKDQAKIDSLEKELFGLSSKFEKERFEHMSGMRKLFADNPSNFRSGMGGYGGCF